MIFASIRNERRLAQEKSFCPQKTWRIKVASSSGSQRSFENFAIKRVRRTFTTPSELGGISFESR